MAKTWTTRTDTPLWQDAHKSHDKGLVRSGTSFDESDNHEGCAKADRISYVPKGANAYSFGDGWIEVKNCVEVGNVILPPTPGVPPTTGGVPTAAEFATFKKVWKWLTA